MITENPHKEDIDSLTATYLAEGLEKEEFDTLHEWVSASPENRKYFNNLQEIWFAGAESKHKKRFNKNNAYQRFLIRTGNYNQKTLSKPKRSVVRLALYAAASIALLFIVSYSAFRQGKEQVKNKFADMIVEAPLGSNTKMQLPDGTLVWLNAGSRISYSQGFGVDERIIYLSGEGYFEVVKDKTPFGVRTDELHVDVLGTKFNFRNYPEDEEATVSLVEGAVLVRNIINDNHSIRLSPDQRVFLNKKSGEMHVSYVNARYTTEWTNGFLFFDEELLPDIAKELERSYHVKITLSDKSLETFRFYGNFTRKEHTIEEILDILASTNRINYKINGKEIELSSK